MGHVVHLMAQENHPENYPFIAESWSYRQDGSARRIYASDVEGEGRCILHKPVLGDLLPVYVRDRYEEFSQVVPMVELGDDAIAQYVDRNVDVLRQVVENNDIRVVHANHAVLMSVIAQRIHEEMAIPYVVMPHGSALEYAVKRDARMRRFAEDAMTSAAKIFVIGDEIRERVRSMLPAVPDLDGKTVALPLGVDTSQFTLVDREARGPAIAQLQGSLDGVARGKTDAQSESLADLVGAGPTIGALREVIEETTGYDLKTPDADLEKKLERIDWHNDRMLLYVGRLIASKGPQNILAALPYVIDHEPATRFVLVGHGPLREPLEALVAALADGNADLVREIVESEGTLENDPTAAQPGWLEEWRVHLDHLERRGELDSYFERGAKLDPDRVIFTGYLRHAELRFLFPCFDVAVFPSAVREAGPLVFLEALASGVFPMGTYFGGMKESIDSLRGVIVEEDLDLMKIDPNPEHVIADLARKLPPALRMGDRWRRELRRAAVENHDWRRVAETLFETLREVAE